MLRRWSVPVREMAHSGWLKPGLRWESEGKRKKTMGDQLQRAPGLLYKIDTGWATRKEMGTIKEIFPPILSLVSKCVQVDFRQAEFLLIIDLASKTSGLT